MKRKYTEALGTPFAPGVFLSRKHCEMRFGNLWGAEDAI
jgi:hypothetical protein